MLLKFGCTREAYVQLIDLKYDNTIDFYLNGSANDRKKTHTCYICMSKFSTLQDLEIHKYVHSGSDESQAEEDYYCDDDYVSLVNECEFLYKIERNLYRGDRVRRTQKLRQDGEQKEGQKTDSLEQENEGNASEIKTDEQNYGMVQKQNDENIEKINVTNEENTTDINKETTKETENNEKIDADSFEHDATYRCESCNVCFGDPSVINSHKVKCRFSCVTCVKSFKSKWAMLIHIIDHLNSSEHPDKEYICKLCKLKLSNSLKYKRHIWTHSKNAIKKIMEAKKKMQLRKKDEKHKMNELKSLTCELCFDTFKTKDEFDSHAAFHKEIDVISQGEIPGVVALDEIKVKRNKTMNISNQDANDINNIKKIAMSRLQMNKLNEKKSPTDNFSLQVQRTGPLSYAVTYKLAAIQNKPTCIPISSTKELIKQEPTDINKHFLSINELVNKTKSPVNKTSVNIICKSEQLSFNPKSTIQSTTTIPSTNTLVTPNMGTTVSTDCSYKTVPNSYVVNNNTNYGTGSIAQLDLSIRSNLKNTSYNLNKQNNIQQIRYNLNNAHLVNYNKTVMFPRQIHPQIRVRNFLTNKNPTIRLPGGQIVVSNSAAIATPPRYYQPQNNQYSNANIRNMLNPQKIPQYSHGQANSNNIQNITNYNQYNQLLNSNIQSLSNFSDYSKVATTQSTTFVNRTKFSPETLNSSTHIFANNPFDDTIVQPEANSKMFEDQDFISLNQFEELCKSKGTLSNITSKEANSFDKVFSLEKKVEQPVKTINNFNEERTGQNTENEKEENGIVKNPLLSEMLSTQNKSVKKEVDDSFESARSTDTVEHNFKENTHNEAAIPNTEISLSSLLSQDSSDLFKDIKEENTKEYIEKYPRLCKTCPKIILNYTSLVCHNMEKTSCNYCPDQFCEVSQLKTHYYSQHRLLFCTECKFLANTNNEFVMHKSNGKCSTRDDLWGSVVIHQQFKNE